MKSRYRDIYPSAPHTSSDDAVRPSARGLLSMAYFRAEPGTMPTQAFDEHHVLINLKEEPQRVENWRDGEHRDFTFHQNEIVVTPAGVESGWRWHIQSHCIVITLDPGSLEAFAKRELGVLLDTQQLKNIPQFLDEDITQAGRMLLEALETDLGSSVMFESLARVFLVKLLQKYGVARADEGAVITAEQYQRVLQFVSENYGRDIRLEDLARQAAISPFHFSRLFKRTIGESPHQFLLSYRVEQAKRQLRQQGLPIIDIALSCGFSDQAHLTRVFRQRVGVTPRQWRLAEGN